MIGLLVSVSGSRCRNVASVAWSARCEGERLRLKVMNKSSPEHYDRESRSAVAVTVVWMLTCMSTAVGTLMVLALRLLILAFPVATSRVHPLEQAAGVLLFVAYATGLLCLALTPLVYRVRTIAP